MNSIHWWSAKNCSFWALSKSKRESTYSETANVASAVMIPTALIVSSSRRLTKNSASTPTSGRNTAIVNQIVWSVIVSIGMNSSHVDDHEHDGSDGGGAEEQGAVLIDPT